MHCLTRTSHLLLALAAAISPVFAGAQAKKQTRPDSLVGCYKVTMGEWSKNLGGDTSYYRVPAMVKFDTVPVGGESGWTLLPRLNYPRENDRSLRFTPYWNVVDKRKVTLWWGDGFTQLRVEVRLVGSKFVGRAKAQSDFMGLTTLFVGWPYADITLDPRRCDEGFDKPHAETNSPSNSSGH